MPATTAAQASVTPIDAIVSAKPWLAADEPGSAKPSVPTSARFAAAPAAQADQRVARVMNGTADH